MTAVLLRPEQHWVCPNCQVTAVTHKIPPPGSVAQEFHVCAGLGGMMKVPMVPDGMRCKVVAVEREDWVGDELVRTNAEGRPIMAVMVTRDDGTDCTVYAPTARARGKVQR